MHERGFTKGYSAMRLFEQTINLFSHSTQTGADYFKFTASICFTAQ